MARKTQYISEVTIHFFQLTAIRYRFMALFKSSLQKFSVDELQVFAFLQIVGKILTQ